jgi:hypothetical protein
VTKDRFELPDGKVTMRVIYEAVDYITGVHRPRVTGPDLSGRQRTILS